MWMDRWMDKQTKKLTNEHKNGQMNRRNYTNFERNLAMVVINDPVKHEFDWTNHFRVRVRNRKCRKTDEWTDKQTKKQTNRQKYTNFKRNLAMMVIIKFDSTNRFRVRKRKMWTNRRTHQSNSRLVTRNPPKNNN